MNGKSPAVRTLVVSSLDQLRATVGYEAATDWREVPQRTIDAFADITGDRNPLHLDPASTNGTPFTGTIAHGAWMLSVIPPWFADLIKLENFSFYVLLGYDRVRFPAALPIGSHIRMRARVDSVEPAKDSARVTTDLTFECDHVTNKPVCAARHILAVYP